MGKGGFLALGTDLSRGNGIGAFSIQILEGLARIAPRQPGTALALTATSDLELPPPWKLRCTRGRLVYSIQALALAVRQRPAEIVVFHVSLLPVALVAGRLVSARVSVVAHGWELVVGRQSMNRWCGYRVDRIVANSRITALEVERLLRDESARRFGPVRLLYPTWDPRNSTTDPAQRALARHAFGFDRSEVVLLTVGRMNSSERYKGHDQVLDALPGLLASIPGLRYLIVGEGDDRNRLTCRAKQLGVSDHVTFAGYRENIADCYAACDLYVMPSTHEGFGIVFLEALASGRPVVAGGIDGSIEAMCWGELGFLCDSLAPESVKRAIHRAIDALAGSEPRVDDAFLREQVELRFGRAAFDRRLADLFGYCTAGADSRPGAA